MTNDRPAIPEDVMHQVRTECYFGCVICGSPVFEYDHIEEYHVVKKHEANNLALLCSMHHSMKTTGKMSVERVAEKRKKPFNKGKLFTAGYKLEGSKRVIVTIGSNRVEWDSPAESSEHACIWINGYYYLAIHFEDNGYTISANVTDKFGETLLNIYKGELIVKTGIWDYTYKRKTLTIRAGKRKILFKAQLSDQGINVEKGWFMDNTGDGFIVKKNELQLIKDGEKLGSFSRTISRDNGIGAYALYDRQKSDLEPENIPKGFAHKHYFHMHSQRNTDSSP